MKNLEKPNLNYYEAHKSYYQKRLQDNQENNQIINLTPAQEDSLRLAFEEYEQLFNENRLNELEIYSFFSQEEKETYLNLYKYSLRYFRKLREDAKYLTGTKVGNCPFCEHGKPTTLDHIVPKTVETGFPEFCDNALNLIPMCSSCNSNKGNIFVNENGNLELVNLYRDLLPEVQYLKATVSLLGSNKISVEFSIEKIV